MEFLSGLPLDAMNNATKDTVDAISLCFHERYENLIDENSDRDPIGFTLLHHRAKVAADYGTRNGKVQELADRLCLILSEATESRNLKLDNEAFEPYKLQIPDIRERPSIRRETTTKQLQACGSVPGCRNYSAKLQ
jgi:hypothetical protein